jgi:hypothetical protein
MLASSMEDRGFKPRSGQIKDYNYCLCFSAEHTALGSTIKDRMARNRDDVAECLPANCCFSELGLYQSTSA